MKSQIATTVIGVGFFVGGMALCEDQSIKALDGTSATKENAAIAGYFTGPNEEFEKLADHVYIYIGKKMTFNAGIDAENLSNSVHVHVGNYTIRPIEPIRQRDRLMKIISTFNCAEYWYRVTIVNTNNIDYFLIQCFSIKRTREYFGAKFGIFPATFPPYTSYLIAKPEDAKRLSPEGIQK